MTEGHEPMPVVIEKARLNVWNLGGFIVGIAVTAFGWGITYNSMSTSIENLKNQLTTETNATRERAGKADNRLQAIEDKIPQFDLIGMQIQRLTELAASNQKAIEATNDRMTRIVESQAGKFDTIISRLGDLTTEIRVVQSQLKEQQPLHRTRFSTRLKTQFATTLKD
jgi:hypothetical protein